METTQEASGPGFFGRLLRWGVVISILGTTAAIWAFSSLDSGNNMVHDVAQEIRDGVDKARSEVRNQGLAVEVENRIRKDKNLQSEKVKVSVQNGSTVVLKGEVPDRDDKDRAVDLARDTRGIRKVIDQISLPPQPRIIEAPATGDDQADPAPRD